MDYREFIDMVLSEVCSDPRIKNGSIDLSNVDHLLVLKEYVVNHTDEEFSNDLFTILICKNGILINEGNYPERQAYNADGILVTFPDPESKKAAIKRGTHFENPPGGAKTEDGEEEEEEPNDMFANFETPEQEAEREKSKAEESPLGTDVSVDDIKFVDSNKSSKEKHRLYDILKSLKTSKDDDDIGDVNVDGDVSFQLDRLHPSVLFALAEKWEFDKSGDWYDEFGKFRGDTDLRGQVHPSRQSDKTKMILWIRDYERRSSGMDVNEPETEL